MATQKNKLGKEIIPSCKIHMVKEDTLDRGLKGGGKEELGEEEWVSLNNLSLRKIKVWQDYSTSLKFKKGEEIRVFCVSWNGGDRGLYSIGGENINGRPFNKS